MIELTDQQVQAMKQHGEVPSRAVNPRTQETFVLVPQDVYDQLTGPEYDDSPWTPEEMEALAWHAGTMIGWEEMHEYDEDEK